ncbi:zinc ribbon domain-containing protein [Aminipila luticellarii]|uniref:Zinc ribbon domain-containing protein n=1 Tax=Aminipila luticellarii TaxID=2507160 RepID=A0A410PYL1_9FIRM|nr:zinc ribbon domain-containing protein [Aminipila luticellarii]QAT43965.1 zinc ribbon domain-containing protein [Aminipila luticellarii]
MFCRKCGKTLLDGDRFCSYCGAQVIERHENMNNMAEPMEEVVYNHEVPDSTIEKPIGQAENIGAPRKTIAQTWQDINEKKTDRQGRPHWNLEGFPAPGEEHKKTEDIRVDWKKRELLKFDPISDPEEQKTKTAQTDMQKEIEPAAKLETKPDIFELFDRQMREEEALNKENKDNKETLIFRRGGSEQPKQKEPEITEGTDLEQELFKPKIGSSESLHTPAEEQIDKFYTFSKKNEEFQKLLDKEYDRLKKMPDSVYHEPLKMPSNIEKLDLNIPINLDPFPVDTNNTLAEKAPVGQEENGTAAAAGTNLLEKEEEIKEAPEEASGQGSSYSKEENSQKLVSTMKTTETEEKTKDEGTKDAAAQEIESVFQEEETEKPVILPWDGMESPLTEFVDEEAGKKISPIAVLLGIIIALLIFEITILGIKCFLPESSAAAFINDKLGVAVNWVDRLKSDEKQEKAEDQTEKEKAKEAQKVNAAAQTDTAPNADKDALIKEALAGTSTNLKWVGADDSLSYVENKDYGDKNINNSKGIENNIWYQDKDGNSVCYDQEIVKTIIQFNSAWIDYVNKKDQAVFQFLKEGSAAYKSTKDFSKAGKVTESFDVLKIGEIRQNDGNFYLWVYEEITVTENGKAKTNHYNHIYHLEPVDKSMKIVSYITL